MASSMPTENGAHRMRHPGTSISKILALSLALGALIPFLPLAYLTWSAYGADVARVEREIEDSNRQIARLAANYLDGLVLRIRQEATDGPHLLPAASGAVRWERVGTDGIVTASQIAPGRVGKTAGYQRFLGTLAETGEARFSRVERWIEGTAPTVILARRGMTPVGGPSFLVGIIDPDALHSDMTARSGELLDRHVYAVDEVGRPLFYSDTELSRRGQELTANPPVRLHLEGGQGPIRFSSVVSGKARLGFVQRLASLDWSVVVSADLGSRLVGLRERYRVLGWTIVFSLFAVMAIVLWTSRRLARPLLEIRDALRASSRLVGEPLEVPASTREVVEYAELLREFDNLSLRFAATERELVQAEKASLLGQLASGVAHEIGTPLNVMSGNAQYLLRKLNPDDPARSALQQIVGQAERITEMLQQLLDFARPTEARRVPFDLRDVVTQTLEMVSAVLRRVDIEVDIDPMTPPVMGDPRLLEHALLNLIVNACQAMSSGGRLSLVVGVGMPQEAGPASDERWVCCRVSDTGCGIAPENLGRIFQPFYTTKPQGEGTGLGLAIVERIVRQLQGSIEVASRLGFGTTFTLRLRPADLTRGAHEARKMQSEMPELRRAPKRA
jgi:signal transduction histidine kinase